MDKLLNCGHCKSTNIKLDGEHVVTIDCLDCGINTGFCGSKEDALRIWNNRQPLQSVLEQLDEKIKEKPLTMQEVKNWVTGDCDPSCCADLCDCPTTWNIDQITRMVRND